LSGHFPPEKGRAMEDSFIDLLYRLGYMVYTGRNGTGLDVIAEFYGKPVHPTLTYQCKLLPPFFAPRGVTAFSLKAGDFAKRDIDELVEKFQKARNLQEFYLKKLEGMVIVTNYTKAEKEINNLLSKKVYCWDGRRLIFYSAKARAIQELWSRGPLQEIPIEVMKNSSYLIETETTGTLKNAILANVHIFIDDHNSKSALGSECIEKILSYIYENSLKQIVESTQMDVQAFLKFHILGIADKTVVKNTYIKYARESRHPQVVFSIEPVIFQYGAAPWATLFT
jgi:hypothetical protein